MCYQLEKLIKEHAAKLERRRQGAARSGDREGPRGGQGRRTSTRSSRAVGELEQASHALSKTLYEAAAGAAGARRRRGRPGGRHEAGGDDDAIDAEFEVKE